MGKFTWPNMVDCLFRELGFNLNRSKYESPSINETEILLRYIRAKG